MDRNDTRHLLAELEFDGPSAAEVAAHKAERFAGQAPTKKSQRERDKEAAAKKAKEEEEAAAKAYEEFVAAFGGDADEGPSGGRRGGGIRTAGKGFVRAGGETYNPLADRQQASPVPGPSTQPVSAPAPGFAGVPTGPRGAGAGAGPSQARPKVAAMVEDDEDEMPLKDGRQKTRAMDNFLEQLKREQAEREERLKYRAEQGGSSVTALASKEYGTVKLGSYDPGDPLTTNVHVSNLPANVVESSLGMFFAQYGAVGSVKIMWPRLDSMPTTGVPVPRRALGGFVAFLRRQDAERAFKELDGVEWGGNVIRTSWGKAVPLPAVPVYEIEGAGVQRDPLRSRRRREDRSRSRSPERRGYSPGRPSESYGRRRSGSRSPPRRQPSEATFTDEGHAEVYSSDSAEDSERERLPKGRLGKLARRRFEALLRTLTSTRDKIARGMVFALEHADAAATIVDLLVESLTLDATPVPRKVARLHLCSDILHNASASVPNAWVYRSVMQARLPGVFDHLGEIHRSFPGRMKAEQFRVQISNIINVWDEWCCFTPDVTDDFKRRLAGEHLLLAAADAGPPPDQVVDPRVDGAAYVPVPEVLPPVPASVPAPTAPVPPPAAVPGGFKAAFRSGFALVALNAEAAGETVLQVEEDVDGEIFGEGGVDGEDVDGEDVDGEVVDVDGEAVPAAAEGGDVDGEAMEYESETDADIFG